MKILVLRLGAMGDILFTTPAVRALKAKFPGSHLTYVSMRKWRFILRGNPHVDRFVGLRYREPKALGRLRTERFDLLVNLHEMEDGARLCQSIHASERLGHQWLDGRVVPDTNSEFLFKTPQAYRRLFESRITYPDLFCRIAQAKPDSMRYDLFPGRVAAWRASLLWRKVGLNRSPGPVALHLHSRGMPAKNWSAESALAVVRALPERRFLVLGYRENVEVTRPLALEPNVTVTLAPMLVQAEMLRRCALFAGIDSGPRQVASAMGTPVLGLYGPRSPHHLPVFEGERSLVVERDCTPCWGNVCSYGRHCLAGIPPDRIVSQIVDMLGER